jgi:hypothetical protein
MVRLELLFCVIVGSRGLYQQDLLYVTNCSLNVSSPKRDSLSIFKQWFPVIRFPNSVPSLHTTYSILYVLLVVEE